MIDQPNVAGIYFANLNLFEWRSNISEPVGAFTGMAGKGVDEQVLVGDVDEVGELYSRAQCNILFVDKLL